MRVQAVAGLPDGFEDLRREAEAGGFGFLARLQAAWAAGTNRFDRPGERLWAAARGARLLGVCGLNVDPFLGDPSVARLRHLYVAAAARGSGAGRALVEAALAHARGRFRWVRLRTHHEQAQRFYAHLGFTPPPPELSAQATHALRVG